MEESGSCPARFLGATVAGTPAHRLSEVGKQAPTGPEAPARWAPCNPSQLPGSRGDRRSPEEETEGAHVPQVHAEHAADLLQRAGPLGLVPARGLQEAVAVGEPQGGVGAAGGAGGAGHVRATRLCVPAAPGTGQGGRGGHTYTRAQLRHAHRQTPVSQRASERTNERVPLQSHMKLHFMGKGRRFLIKLQPTRTEAVSGPNDR